MTQKYEIESLAIPLDVTSGTFVDSAYDSITKHFDGLDILVNNAGVAFGMGNAIEDYDENDWINTFDVNLHGAFRVSKKFLPTLIERKGSIVNISSRAGKVPFVFSGAYTVSEGCDNHADKVTGQRNSPAGVRVNAACPGLILTDLQIWRFKAESEKYGCISEERREELTKTVSQNKLTDPSEVASVVVFLAGTEASHIT